MTIELEEITCSEIVERIHRTEFFLHECKFEERHENLELITRFIDEVDITKDFIKEAVVNLVYMKKGEPVGVEGRRSTLKKFIGASVIIETIIRNTYYIKGINARPETDVFVKRLFPELFWRKIIPMPTIVLLPEYNFIHENVLSIVIKILFDAGILGIKEIPRNPIISLPNIAFMNPLVWSILIHELGHEIESSRNIGKTIIEEQNLKGDRDELNLTRNWIIEFFSDLFAIRTLGPAFLVPYITFSLLDPNLKDSHSKHPPTYRRIEVLYNYLRNEMGLEHKIIDEYMKLLNERYDLMPKITMPELFGINFREKEKILPSCLLQFDEMIEILEPKLNQFPTVFQKEKLESCDSLAEELGRNIPICSIAKKKDLDEKVSNIKSNKEQYIEELFENFVERPVGMSEILNACWISKFNDDCSRFSEIFLKKEIESNKDYFERFRNFGEYLNYKDSLIMKSIETSDICHIFGEVDENDTE